MKKINWISLVISIAISLGVGAVSAFFTSGSMNQYMNMYKPPLSPPGWVFPIVWTILFILMGIAAYIIYEADTSAEAKKNALFTYGLQLFVNFGWSIIFFNVNAYWLAFVWLLLLWYLIYSMFKSFSEISRIAGYLIIPYLAWVTFAGYLTLAIALH